MVYSDGLIVSVSGVLKFCVLCLVVGYQVELRVGLPGGMAPFIYVSWGGKAGPCPLSRRMATADGAPPNAHEG